MRNIFPIKVATWVILLTGYERYERAMLDFVAWGTARKRNLALFMAIIFVAPMVLMLI